jgi:hypothetical protein
LDLNRAEKVAAAVKSNDFQRVIKRPDEGPVSRVVYKVQNSLFSIKPRQHKRTFATLIKRIQLK